MKKCIAVLATLVIFGCATPQFTVTKVNDELYRGPRPNTTDIQTLKDMGIKSIINLEEFSSGAIEKEKEFSESIGIVFTHIPMSNFTRPKAVELLKAYKEISEGLPTPVYVHCLHGQDRTGFVIATYRMLHDDWTMEQAYDEAIKMGHKYKAYDDFPFYWKKSLRDVEFLKRSVILLNKLD